MRAKWAAWEPDDAIVVADHCRAGSCVLSIMLILSLVAPALAQTTFTDVSTASGIAVPDNRNATSFGDPPMGRFQ
jgi:hypothetical protein